VPATEKEALSSSLLGFFEKNRFKNYLVFCNEFDEKKYKDSPRNDLYNKYPSVGKEVQFG